MPAIERLIVASAPMQELMMTARKIYRWDNPRLTSYYLAGYGLVWAFNMVLPATLLGMVYLILNRKIHEPTLNDLREDVKRTEDRNETALSITEFMEKEGDEGWVDELIRVVGPWIMVQLADLANLMEVLRNFYEWRVPFRTAITVAILTIGALVTAFVPAWLLIRGVTLGMGIAFFGLFPISSRYPDYRLLASPFRWLFWKIPTHAEWAVKQLQAKGARFNETHNSGPSGTAGRSGRGGQGQTQAIDSGVSTGADTGAKPTEHDPLGYRGIPTKLVDGKPVYIHDGSSASGSAPASQGATAVPSGKDIEKQHAENSRVLDYGSYNCKWQSHSGQLILTSHGIRFQSGSSTLWEVPYDKLGRLEKSTRQVANKLKNVTPISSNSGEDLRIITTSPLVGGEEMKFDEAKGQGQEARESRFANASKQGGVTGGTRKKGPEEGKNESTAGRNMMQQVERKEEAGEHGERLLEVKNVQERDQCFSQIVGFSHVQWVVIW